MFLSDSRSDRLREKATANLRRHHHRREQLDVEADNGAVERWIGDTDHGHRHGIQVHRRADDVRIGGEGTPP